MAADEAPRFSITDLYIVCGASDKRSTIVERYNVYELIVHWEHGSWCWRNPAWAFQLRGIQQCTGYYYFSLANRLIEFFSLITPWTYTNPHP
jgi:hypothetical protein